MRDLADRSTSAEVRRVRAEVIGGRRPHGRRVDGHGPLPRVAAALALQRSIGNRAVARLISGADRRVLQRAFGFEFELKVPLTSGKPAEPVTAARSQCKAYDVAEPVEPDERSNVVATAPDFEVKIDHSQGLREAVPPDARAGTKSSLDASGSCPIVELVTKPLDELADEERTVRRRMKAVVAFASEIDARTNGFKERRPLDDLPGIEITGKLKGKNYVGAERSNRGDCTPVPAALVISTDAFVQQTYGVSLKRVTKEFSNRASQRGSRLGREERGRLTTANRDAETIVTDLESKGWLEAATAPGDANLLRGFFALMAYYLHPGASKWDKAWDEHEAGKGKLTGNEIQAAVQALEQGPPEVTLAKKHLGLFYVKTALSTLAQDSAIRTLLAPMDQRTKIRDKLLSVTERSPNAPLIPGYNKVFVGEFVDEVFAGRSDPFLAKSMNEYSKELVAGRLGRSDAAAVGVVVENRKFAVTEGKDETRDRLKPASWEAMAVNLYWYLRALHDADLPEVEGGTWSPPDPEPLDWASPSSKLPPLPTGLPARPVADPLLDEKR